MGLEGNLRSGAQAEAAARKAAMNTLEEIEEQIGEAKYREIIGKLSTGDVSDLSDEDKEIIAQIKQERGGRDN